MLSLDFLKLGMIQLSAIHGNITHKKMYTNDLSTLKYYFQKCFSSKETLSFCSEDPRITAAPLLTYRSISDITLADPSEIQVLIGSVEKVRDLLNKVVISRYLDKSLPHQIKSSIACRLNPLLKSLDNELSFSIIEKIAALPIEQIDEIVSMVDSFPSRQPDPLKRAYIAKLLLDVPSDKRNDFYRAAFLLCKNIQNLSCSYFLIESLKKIPYEEQMEKAKAFSIVLSNVEDKNALITLWDVLKNVSIDKLALISQAQSLFLRGPNPHEKVNLLKTLCQINPEKLPTLLYWENEISLQSPSVTSSLILQTLSSISEEALQSTLPLLNQICDQNPAKRSDVFHVILGISPFLKQHIASLVDLLVMDNNLQEYRSDLFILLSKCSLEEVDDVRSFAPYYLQHIKSSKEKFHLIGYMMKIPVSVRYEILSIARPLCRCTNNVLEIGNILKELSISAPKHRMDIVDSLHVFTKEQVKFSLSSLVEFLRKINPNHIKLLLHITAPLYQGYISRFASANILAYVYCLPPKLRIPVCYLATNLISDAFFDDDRMGIIKACQNVVENCVQRDLDLIGDLVGKFPVQHRSEALMLIGRLLPKESRLNFVLLIRNILEDKSDFKTFYHLISAINIEGFDNGEQSLFLLQDLFLNYPISLSQKIKIISSITSAPLTLQPVVAAKIKEMIVSSDLGLNFQIEDLLKKNVF